MLVWIFATAVLVLLVVVPLAWLFIKSFQAPQTGSFTLNNYFLAFSTWRYLEPIVNSLKLALAVACSSVAVGSGMAWLVARSDMPGRSLVRLLVIASFITPPFLGAIAWILLAAPRSGWLNRLYMAVTGEPQGAFNIYTLAGCVFVIAIYSYPYAFTFVSAALELISSEMEHAAQILGAGACRTALSVTLPMVLPGIVAGFIMSFLEAIALFGSPALILIPARKNVMTTQLWQFFQFPTKVELAAAYALPLLMLTVALLLLQRRLLARKGFAAVGGKGGQRRLVRLGVWRYPALIACLGVSSLSLFLPYAVLLSTSLSQAWGRGFSAANFTLRWYNWALFGYAGSRLAIRNSLVYSLLAATFALALAVAIAYIANRRLVRGHQVLSFLAMTPFVIPGIVLATGFIAAYTHPPLVLYGTAAIMVIAFTTRFLPIAYANCDAILKSVGAELENAGRILGAGRLHMLREVTLPLVKRGLFGGWVLIFIQALRELSAAVLLFTVSTKVVSTLIFDLSDEGNFEAVSALGVLMLVLTFAVVAFGYRLIGPDFMAHSREA